MQIFRALGDYDPMPDLPKLKRLWWVSLAWMLVLCWAAASQPKFPKPTGWVSDFAGVISQADEQKITSLITNLERQTTAELAVVTISYLAGTTIDDYAVRLFKQWGIGKKGKDNGVLLLFAIQDRKWRIEVGYGLEPILPDGLCGGIGRKQMVPLLKKGKYGEAAYAGAYRIAEIILSDADQGTEMLGERPAPPPRAGGLPGPVVLIMAFMVCFFAGAMIKSVLMPAGPLGLVQKGCGGCLGFVLGLGWLVSIPVVIALVGWLWGMLYVLVGLFAIFLGLLTKPTVGRGWSTGGIGGFSGGGGGGFGGFGGGCSGGGGASGGW